MATAVLTNVPTTIHLFESTTGVAGDSFTLEPDDKVQGGNSVACAQTGTGANDVYVTGTWDFSTAVHLRMYFKNTMIGTYGQTEANDGLQIFLSDGTNTAYYTLGGADTYKGGWQQLVLDTATTPTSGTITLSSVTSIGIRINTHSKPRNVPANMWLDAWYYGDGYTVTGGTSGDEIDWSHIAALDAVEAYNIVARLEDNYFLTGDIKIGNGATTTYFKSGQKVTFTDKVVDSTLYSVLFQGSACNVAISGGSYFAAGTQDYKFDASDTNINSFVMSGVQFEKASAVTFATGQSVKSCVYDNCGQVVTNNCIFKLNSFRNSVDTGGACLHPADDSNWSDNSFTDCTNAVEYDVNSDSTSPTLLNSLFTTNTNDYNNTSGASVTIAKSGTSNPASFNATGDEVLFTASNTLNITVEDASTGALLINARVHVVAAAGGTMTVGEVIINAEITGADGKVTGVISASDQPYEGLVTEVDSPDLYVAQPISGTIPNGTTSRNVGMVRDD